MAEIELSFDPKSIRKYLVLGFLFLFLGSVFVIEVAAALSSPIAFGDEGYHVAIARHMGTQVEYPAFNPLQGSDFNEEKYIRPPLWNLTEGSFYFLFGFNEGIVKILVPFISFMTGLAVFTFVRRLYSDVMGLIAAILTVTLPSFITYSLFFYSTVPYVFFFTVGLLSLLTAIKTGERKFWVVAGLISGLAILYNIAGLFLAILVLVMGVYQLLKTRSMPGLIDALKTYGVVALIILLIISPWAFRNASMFYEPGCSNPYTIMTGACIDQSGILPESETEGLFVGRNLGGATEGSILSMGIPNYLRFAYGFSNPNELFNMIGLLFIPFSFLAGLVVVARRREVSDIAIIAAVLIFLFIFTQTGGFFEGRAEDTSRYFLGAAPLIGLVAAIYWSSLRKEGSKFDTPMVLVIIAVIAIVAWFSFDQKVSQLPVFKAFVPTFFEACDWVKENTKEDSYLFSLHTHPTRFNCDRPAVWEVEDKGDILLSNDLEVVTSSLEKHGIDYIFVQKFALSSQALQQAYPLTFVDFLESNDENFVKVYENGPTYRSEEFNQCASSGGCDMGTIIYEVR